jgi:peptidylprolyl isomerase
LLTPLVFAACAVSSSSTSSGSAADSPRAVPGSAAQLVFDPSLDVHLNEMTRTASGLYWKDFTVGTGQTAQLGDLVRVRYDVHLTNGKRIEGSDPDAPPYEFRMGAHQVIAGWDEGITGMRAGGRRQLIIPPSLGYGGRRQGEIPGGSVMVVNLQLIQIVR